MDDQPEGLTAQPSATSDTTTADDIGKWWRWETHAGRWMPSEPPQGAVDATEWCVSAAAPAAATPGRSVVEGGRRPAGTKRQGAAGGRISGGAEPEARATSGSM